MSNGENTVLMDGEREIPSSDETLSVFSGDHSSSTDIDELYNLLGDICISEANDPEVMNNTEHDASSVVDEHSVSALEELELMFSSSKESADTDFSLQNSEQYSAGEDFNSISALDELKAFLSDGTQDEIGDIETSSPSILEFSFENRRSVLDELQNLLQSCLDELKADTKNTIDDMSVFTDAVYPSRDELHDLLEDTLGQLMLLSNSSMSMTSSGSVSVLDELNNFMHETGECDVSSVNEEDVMESSSSNSIIDELNLLLGNTDSEMLDIPLESDDSASGISDESFVQDELATYMAELSDDAAIDDKTSIEEIVEDAADTEFDSSISTLEELEVMLNEIGIYDNDETSDSIEASDDVFSYETEVKSLCADNNKEKKVKADNRSHSEVQSNATVPDKIKTKKTVVNASVEDEGLSYEQDSNNRIPITGLLFATVGAVAIYGFWSLLHTSDEINNHSEIPVIQQHEPASVGALEKGSNTVISTGEDSIYELLAKTEASDYVPISNYEDESLNTEFNNTDIEDITTQKLYEEDSGEAAVDESLNKENTENKTTLNVQEEDRGEKNRDDSKELISLQLKNLQQENRANLNQLNKRMIEAEVSIGLLQAENKIIHNQKNFVEPQGAELSEVPGRPELSVEQGVIEQPAQKITVTKVQDENSDLWSVYLSSYYGKPPPASELEYLENAGISYEIKKAIVDEKVWYRVIVDDFSAYAKAMEYSNGIRENVGRDDIWVNRSQ